MNPMLWPSLVLAIVISVVMVCVTVWSVSRAATPHTPNPGAPRARFPRRATPPALSAGPPPAVPGGDPTAELTQRLLEPRQLLEVHAAEAADGARRLVAQVAVSAAELAAGSLRGGPKADEVRRLLGTVTELLRQTERGDTLNTMVGSVYGDPLPGMSVETLTGSGTR
ncbi:hypothetical protein [Streptomyces mayteni]